MSINELIARGIQQPNFVNTFQTAQANQMKIEAVRQEQMQKNRINQLLQESATSQTDPISKLLVQTGNVPTYANYEIAKQKLNRPTLDNMDTVQSSEIMDNGLVQLVYKSGKIDVVEPGEAKSKLVNDARTYEDNRQAVRAGARQTATDSARVSKQSFDVLGKVQSNISNLRQAINLVNQGAETGVLSSKLPSVRAASIRLDNLKNQLGLDVVGAVTFGALSKGELDLALNTALPTNLEGDALIKWAKDKINAQEKLAKYLEDQAKFLGTPGNTIADWLDRQEVAPSNKGTEQILRFDSNGNQIK